MNTVDPKSRLTIECTVLETTCTVFANFWCSLKTTQISQAPSPQTSRGSHGYCSLLFSTAMSASQAQIVPARQAAAQAAAAYVRSAGYRQGYEAGWAAGWAAGMKADVTDSDGGGGTSANTTVPTTAMTTTIGAYDTSTRDDGNNANGEDGNADEADDDDDDDDANDEMDIELDSRWAALLVAGEARRARERRCSAEDANDAPDGSPTVELDLGGRAAREAEERRARLYGKGATAVGEAEGAAEAMFGRAVRDGGIWWPVVGARGSGT